MACFSHASGTYPACMEIAGIRLSLNQDGTVHVMTGVVKLGQGSNTVIAQMAAHTLGIPLCTITIRDIINAHDSGMILNPVQARGLVHGGLALLSEHPGARLVAGGTDVLIRLRHGSRKFTRLVDIHDLDELRFITTYAEEKHPANSLWIFGLPMGWQDRRRCGCPTAEKAAIHQIISEALLTKISDAVQQDLSPRTSWRATWEFRLHIISELAERVTRTALDRTRAGKE